MCSACGIPPRLTFPSSSILPSPWMRPAHYSVLSRCRYNWNRQSCSPPCRCAQSPSAWPPSARSKSSSSGMDLRWGIQFAAPCIIKCALAAGRPARTRQGVGRKSKIKSRQVGVNAPPQGRFGAKFDSYCTDQTKLACARRVRGQCDEINIHSCGRCKQCRYGRR
jgi:hypothetical protein